MDIDLVHAFMLTHRFHELYFVDGDSLFRVGSSVQSSSRGCTWGVGLRVRPQRSFHVEARAAPAGGVVLRRSVGLWVRLRVVSASGYGHGH